MRQPVGTRQLVGLAIRSGGFSKPSFKPAQPACRQAGAYTNVGRNAIWTMNSVEKLAEDITKQLSCQGIIFQFLTEPELDEVERKWKAKFIGKRTAPNLDFYKWHIFSYHKDNRIEGEKAIAEYKHQFPADLYIFNERLQYGLKCLKASTVPDILMDDFTDDIYISHHNMKWTFVLPHEIPHIGPFFSK